MKGMLGLTKKELFELIEQYCKENDIREHESVCTLFYCAENYKSEQQQCLMFNKPIYNP